MLISTYSLKIIAAAFLKGSSFSVRPGSKKIEFPPHPPNMLHEILKNLLPYILKLLEERPTNVLKTSQKDFRRLATLGRSQVVNFEQTISLVLFSILFHQMCA